MDTTPLSSDEDQPRSAVVVVESPAGDPITVTVHPPGIVHIARFARVAIRLGRLVAEVCADRQPAANQPDTLPLAAIIAKAMECVDESLLDLIFSCCASDPRTELKTLGMGDGMLIVEAWMRVTIRGKVLRPLVTAIEMMASRLTSGQTPAPGAPPSSAAS